MNAITPYDVDRNWLAYFNQAAAVQGVMAHIATFPGAQTPERHTERAYGTGLAYFLKWSGDRLPTEALITEFIAHLKARGLKSSTIGSKYLAPLRLYLKKLARQHRRISELSGPEWLYVAECKEHIAAAKAVKTPRNDTTTNIAPLWRPEFKRLSVREVNKVLRSIDTSTIAGKRDYALLYVAFSTGLRLAELHRITLGSITLEGDTWLIRVRGKRSNVDPVPVTKRVVNLILTYVASYNTDLAPDDPRRIEDHGPLWQSLTRSSKHLRVGASGYDPAAGLSVQGIRQMIRRRAGIAAHDTRRTCAAIAYDKGMSLPDIQALLRHKDAAVTLGYIGTKPDYNARMLSNYVTFG